MKAIRKEKEFDCVKMKNDIQAKIYAETKDMDFKNRRAYIDKHLQSDAFWQRINGLKRANSLLY
ncbi:MAG: hypothetical protein LBQ31_02385 [Bacteroidales bacterium]|jgi:hypothetical protein|nr:hypothetical protein [Bacteroidales bacterium]